MPMMCGSMDCLALPNRLFGRPTHGIICRFTYIPSTPLRVRAFIARLSLLCATWMLLAAVGRGPEWKAEIGVRASHCPGRRAVPSAPLRSPLLAPDQSRVKGGNDTTLWSNLQVENQQGIMQRSNSKLDPSVAKIQFSYFRESYIAIHS